MVGRGCTCANNSVRSLGRDHIGDVADALIVQVEIAKVRLTCVDQDAQKLKNRFVALTFSEGAHGWLDQIEFLLEIVEADLGVKAVPVQHFVLNEGRCAQFTVDVLLI